MQKTKLTILLGRALKESFVNLWRNRVLSVATITVITVTIFIFNILFAINTTATAELESFSRKVDIILYLKNTVEYHTVKNLIEDIKKVNGVLDATYTSKKDAISKLSKTYPSIEDFFKKFEVENPLPASINIKTKNPSYHDAVWKFATTSRHKDLFDLDITGTDKDNKYTLLVTKNLQDIISLTEKIIYLILVSFIIGGILIIINAIKLTVHSRRKEIEIMKLIGVSRFLIRLPYIFEAIWYFAISTVISMGLYHLLIDEIFITADLKMWGLTLLVGIMIGIFSSIVATQKHLNAS